MARPLREELFLGKPKKKVFSLGQEILIKCTICRFFASLNKPGRQGLARDGIAKFKDSIRINANLYKDNRKTEE